MRHTLLILQSTTNTYQVEWAKPPLQSRLRSSIIFKSYELLSATHQIIILAHTDASHRRNGRRVALVEDKAAVIVEGEPEEDWRARREVKRIAPVIERSRAGDSKEPRAAIIVDGVGEQLVT